MPVICSSKTMLSTDRLSCESAESVCCVTEEKGAEIKERERVEIADASISRESLWSFISWSFIDISELVWMFSSLRLKKIKLKLPSSTCEREGFKYELILETEDFSVVLSSDAWLIDRSMTGDFVLSSEISKAVESNFELYEFGLLMMFRTSNFSFFMIELRSEITSSLFSFRLIDQESTIFSVVERLNSVEWLFVSGTTRELSATVDACMLLLYRSVFEEDELVILLALRRLKIQSSSALLSVSVEIVAFESWASQVELVICYLDSFSLSRSLMLLS